MWAPISFPHKIFWSNYWKKHTQTSSVPAVKANHNNRQQPSTTTTTTQVGYAILCAIWAGRAFSLSICCAIKVKQAISCAILIKRAFELAFATNECHPSQVSLHACHPSQVSHIYAIRVKWAIIYAIQVKWAIIYAIRVKFAVLYAIRVKFSVLYAIWAKGAVIYAIRVILQHCQPSQSDEPSVFNVAIQVSQTSLQRFHPSQASHRLCQIDKLLYFGVPTLCFVGWGVPSVPVIIVTF
jgi:hypothetical protein